MVKEKTFLRTFIVLFRWRCKECVQKKILFDESFFWRVENEQTKKFSRIIFRQKRNKMGKYVLTKNENYERPRTESCSVHIIYYLKELQKICTYSFFFVWKCSTLLTYSTFCLVSLAYEAIQDSSFQANCLLHILCFSYMWPFKLWNKYVRRRFEWTEREVQVGNNIT